MSSSDPYILIAVVVLILVVILAFVLGHGEVHNRITPMAGLAFAFVVAGIIFGQDRIIGYGLLGIAVILAVFDILQHRKT